LPDPAHVMGTEEEIETAFQATFDALKSRINQMLALPIETMDGAEIVSALNAIGKTA
jgi:arsenate reductase (thioredoxin)